MTFAAHLLSLPYISCQGHFPVQIVLEHAETVHDQLHVNSSYICFNTSKLLKKQIHSSHKEMSSSSSFFNSNNRSRIKFQLTSKYFEMQLCVMVQMKWGRDQGMSLAASTSGKSLFDDMTQGFGLSVAFSNYTKSRVSIWRKHFMTKRTYQ